MSNFEFGFTMLVVGMGGTLSVLFLFSVVMEILKKTFPTEEDKT
jgi:Na+-transporting methylmalonyl-CoA/oxaloacetate decarboxylase gamma subunit